MRRIFAAVLIGVGVFGLVFAVVERFWAYPNGEKTPLDLDILIVATGPGQVYNATTGQVDAVALRADRTVKVDSQASDSTNVVVQERLCIVIQVDNPPPCVSGTDKRLLTYTTDRVAADRKTGESVNDPKYGGNVNGDTSIKHVGLTYKWPFHAKKQTYQFFNPDVGKAFPATYQGTEELKGMTLYKYVIVTPKTEADVFKGIPGNYEDTITVLVDPVTGTIVKGVEHQLRTFRGGALDGKTAVDLTLTFNGDTIDFQAKKAKDGRAQIDLASKWLPLTSLIVGIVALAGGIFLFSRGDRQPPPSEEVPLEQPGPHEGPPDYASPPDYGAPPQGQGLLPGSPPDYEVTQPIQR
jgi:hypothetical protein